MFKNVDLDVLGVSGHQSERIELTLSYGFKGFDLDLDDFRQQVEQKGLDHARRLIDSARLKIGSFPVPIDWDAEEAQFERELEKLPELVELAAAVGCHRARATISPAGDVRPYHENFELYRRRFAQVGDVLAKGEISLGVGFLAPDHHRADRAFQFVHTVDELLLLVKSVSASNVGVVLDVWHWHVSGGTPAQIDMLDAGDIVVVDLAEATTPHGESDVQESTRALPAAGGGEETVLIDSATVLVALAHKGYDGPVTPKPHSSCFEGMRRDQIVQRTSEALDRVWKAAGLNKRGKLATGQPAASR